MQRTMLALIVGVLMTACAAESGATADRPAISPALPTAEATVAPRAEPSTAPTTGTSSMPAPPDLAGTWRRNLQGEEVLVTLRDTGYRIQRGGEMGSGSISVEGDVITFFGSSRCASVGRYTWAIEDGRLRLTEIDDPCSGRDEVFRLGTLGRVDG